MERKDTNKSKCKLPTQASIVMSEKMWATIYQTNNWLHNRKKKLYEYGYRISMYNIAFNKLYFNMQKIFPQSHGTA